VLREILVVFWGHDKKDGGRTKEREKEGDESRMMKKKKENCGGQAQHDTSVWEEDGGSVGGGI